MRNPILGIAIAIVFAASSQSALAGEKTKTTDKASPQHYSGAAKGSHIPEVTIEQ